MYHSIMPWPTNVKELRAFFIGLVQYYGRFIPPNPCYGRGSHGSGAGPVRLRLKETLASALYWHILTLASAYRLGDILSHVYSDGSERLI